MKCKYYKPYFDTLRKIIDEYYGLRNCGCGGPLHILLDDDNYDIGSIHFCIEKCFEELVRSQFENSTFYDNTENILGIMICNEYAKMSLEERAAFDSYRTGNNLECDGNCECCRCDVLDDLHDIMKENEEAELKK